MVATFGSEEGRRVIFYIPLHPISVLVAQAYSLLIDYQGPECYHVLATCSCWVSSLCNMLMGCDDISWMIEVTVIHPLLIVTSALVSAAPVSWTVSL